jgi:hypothetical protein
MGRKSRRRVVKGRVAQVDLLRAGGGLVLSVGKISMWLDRADAGDVAETLVTALEVEAEGARRKRSGDHPRARGASGKRRPN